MVFASIHFMQGAVSRARPVVTTWNTKFARKGRDAKVMMAEEIVVRIHPRCLTVAKRDGKRAMRTKYATGCNRQQRARGMIKSESVNKSSQRIGVGRGILSTGGGY
jgi:hypothetical protein